MKTILFIDKDEKDLWSSFLEYDFLLDEFQSQGLFAVCPWHRNGASINTAIPDLAEILGSENDWQAVIVSDLRLPEDELRYDVHFDNPFDFADRYDAAPGDKFEESVHPIVRLTHMLGGLPEKIFIDWHKDDNNSTININDFEMVYADGDSRYDLIERYRLGLPQPTQIICVTPRDVDEAFFDARDQDLLSYKEDSLLDFWQRNDYPAKARFVVLDRVAPMVEALLPEDTENNDEVSDKAIKTDTEEQESNRRSAWFDFWMCMLTLMTSTILPSDFRAYTVYRMSITVDEISLGDMLASRRSEWVAAREMIEARCQSDADRLKVSEYVMNELPSTETLITMPFDQVSNERLYSDSSEVRFYKDKPQNDRTVWHMQKERISDEFRELLRAPRRALYNAAVSFNACKPIPSEELEYCVLNEYQKDKLSDEIREREYTLACDVGAKNFEFESHKKAFNEGDANVIREIDKRSGKIQSIVALVLSLVILLVGLLPYCFGFLDGKGVAADTVLMTVVCCLLMAVVWIVTMIFMRNKVRDAYHDFDNATRNTVSSLTNEARRLEKKLSSYATFRKEWSILDRQNHLDLPTEESNRLGYFSALLKTRIRDIDEIACKYDTASSKEISEIQYDWEILKRLVEDKSFYNIGGTIRKETSLAEAKQKSFLDVPYTFISHVLLEPIKVH